MKKIIFIGSLFFVINLSAQNGTAPSKSSASIKMPTAADTLQYALGAYLAQWVNENGFLINNAELFLKGMDDIFQNKIRSIPDSIITPIVAGYIQMGLQEKTKKASQELFISLKEKEGVGMLPNGIYYNVLQTGEGDHPGLADSIILHMKGTTATGVLFQDTYKDNQPIVTTLAATIPGLKAALPMMAAGSKWELFIPAKLAFGNKSSTLIPANSAIQVIVELVAVKRMK